MEKSYVLYVSRIYEILVQTSLYYDYIKGQTNFLICCPFH